jgi:hypothetical protein
VAAAAAASGHVTQFESCFRDNAEARQHDCLFAAIAAAAASGQGAHLKPCILGQAEALLDQGEALQHRQPHYARRAFLHLMHLLLLLLLLLRRASPSTLHP